ncbi:hypothetical protein C7S18_09640 [Ahniella affigens]|uniref:Uncharacterized protein n=1 Tax=Ahniella affigens TaxID=2021234 RepID=A0A2P1PRJ4_9GAMM|nr:hypothetical protein [Ahniella affigens]AVP97442.1 hypothetical protein C7S18_09640 [Ahniella affigens]
MKRALYLACVSVLAVSTASATPPDFTYQGYLQDAGNPATGTYDFRFTLQYDAPMMGLQIIGTPQTKDDLAVTQGVFSVPLDFGATLTNLEYLLKIEVRPGASTGSYTVLTPDTQIKPTPQAQYAEASGFAASIAPNTVGSTQIIDGNVQTPDIGFQAVNADKVDPSTVQLRVSGTCPSGSSINAIEQGGTVTCETDDSGSSITGVTAGTGLSGGGTTGTITLGIANGGVGSAQTNVNQVQVRVNGFCIPGNSIRAIANDGSVTCEADDAGTGTVTSIATGTGLTGGPITSSGTIAIANNGVASAQIFDGTITSTDINTASVQARVNGTCGSGSSISSISATGAVTCEPDDGITSLSQVGTGFPTSSSLSDTTPGAGIGDLSAATGVDGLPLVAFHDSINNDLVVVHCDTIDCVTRTKTVVDSAGVVGLKPRVIIAGSGNFAYPLITYYDQTNSVLKALRCSDLACTTSVSAALTATAGASTHHDVARNANSGFVVTFHDPNAGDLRGVACTNYNACGAAFDIDNSANNVGSGVVIATNFTRYIAYRDTTTNNLLLKVCNAPTTGSGSCGVTRTLDASGAVQDVHDILVTETLLPVVLYQKGGNEFTVSCTATACSSATAPVQVAAPGGSAGAMSVGADGLPLIYLTGTISANYTTTIRCTSALCSTSVVLSSADYFNPVTGRPAMLRSSRDFPILFSRVTDSLAIQICDNRFCSGSSRAR